MIDKGKYASHGAMITKLPNQGLNKWQRSKLAVINPLPNSVARQKNYEFKKKRNDMKLQSKSMNPMFKFQQRIVQKPLQQDLKQPFLYVQKVIHKMKTNEVKWQIIEPFVATGKVHQTSAKNSKVSNNLSRVNAQVPEGYVNLFQYEQDKRKTAHRLFSKFMNANITNLKRIYLMWNRKADLQTNPLIDIKESEFVEFNKQLLHQNITQKQIKHFYQLYKNKESRNQAAKMKPLQSQRKNQEVRKVTELKPGMISIKSLSFNYQRFLRSEVQITNIMSEKALKQRYNWAKLYLTLFDQNYAQLKQGMNYIRQYQQSLRQHYKSMYEAYENPFQEQINSFKKQLQRPIIKYDKHKKEEITSKILQLQDKSSKNYQYISDEYERFMGNFENTIVKNHDLFFNKRTVCKLVLPILKKTIYINKEALNREIQAEQEKKRLYLECLSNIVVQMDKDKKYLGEDCFTLADIVQMVLMKFNKEKNKSSRKPNKLVKQNYPSTPKDSFITQLGEQFVLKSMKKLIKQIKKQYLLKNQLYVEDIQQFPADQQIPLQLLHTCFQMQCTKVLSKNHIWTQLLILIPQIGTESRLHQQTITCNQCLGYLKKYLLKLDENSHIERNRSKQISLLIQNAKLQDLWYYNDIVQKVDDKLTNLNQEQDQQQQQDQVNQLNKEKKVKFFQIAQSYIQNQNRKYLSNQSQVIRQKDNSFGRQQTVVANDILKAIFNLQHSKMQKNRQSQSLNASGNFLGMNTPNKYSQIPESLEAIKTLAKSFFIPQKDKKLSTNAFDIRFYQKINNQQQQQQEQEILRLGTSALLSHLPKPDQFNLFQNDPLKISRLLQKNISNLVSQQQRVLHDKLYTSNVKQGVDVNYFRDKIKLQNKPTRYDSEGKSKYSVLFPVGYYEGIMASQDQKKDQKWYLRSHHVETLTQNPLSKKDNFINTQYQSKLDRITLKKKPQDLVIEENVNRKQMLIQSLEQRINSLKSNLENVQRNKQTDGQKVPNAVLNKYLTGITEGKQDKDLQMAAYEAVLYDLRRNQRNMVVDYRDKRNQFEGQPQNKWWQKKDSSFNVQHKKERMLLSDSLKEGSPHRQYVQKLKNRQIY